MVSKFEYLYLKYIALPCLNITKYFDFVVCTKLVFVFVTVTKGTYLIYCYPLRILSSVKFIYFMRISIITGKTVIC